MSNQLTEACGKNEVEKENVISLIRSVLPTEPSSIKNLKISNFKIPGTRRTVFILICLTTSSSDNTYWQFLKPNGMKLGLN